MRIDEGDKRKFQKTIKDAELIGKYSALPKQIIHC